MNQPNDLFLLLLNLSQMRCEQQIRALFLESIGSLFVPRTFQYADKEPDGTAYCFPIATWNAAYGYIVLTDTAALSNEEKTLLHNATQMLAVVLERLALEKKMEQERASIEDLADERLRDLEATVDQLRESRNAYINLIEDLTRENTQRKKAEEALRESEEKYRGLVENTQEILYILDENARITYVSPNIELLGGYTQADMMARSFVEFVHPADLDGRIEQFKKVMAGIIEPSEYRYMTRDGRYVWVQTNARPIIKDGRPAGVQGVLTDITERKKAEDALRESEARFRSITENAFDLIAILDLEGCYIYCNNRYTDILGYTPQELIGRNCFEFVHPDDRDRTEKTFYDALAEGAQSKQLETRTVCRDGTYKRIENRAKLLMDDMGNPVHVYLNAQDVTERKQAEAERERLAMAIEQASETIVITDTQPAIQYVNPAFTTVTGYAREEVIGKNPRILNSGEQDEAFYRTMWDTLTRGATWRGRFVNKKKDGTQYTVESVISPIQDDSGQIVNYVAVKRDITEEIRLEAQLRQSQKMESVGRLAGGVAHDFNNMLGAILGYTEMAIEKTPVTAPLRGDLEEVRKAAERSASLTRQLLAFARKQTIAPRTLDLNETIAGLLKMLRRLIGEDIQLAWHPGVHLWPVKMDPGQIDQILANLCVNARDAIAGVGTITIETENKIFDEEYCVHHMGFTPGAYVLLMVSDNGHGIDKETQDKLFEPFFTTKEIGKGTGLGLATTYGVVKQNNGFINVYSELGQGTTFKVYLPRHHTPVETIPQQGPAQAAPDGNETILLVEDELAILRMVTTILERHGYNVLAASTPGEAIRLARQHAGAIHLLITDVVMPEMNGRDLAKNLVSLCPEMKRMFMSGYTANAGAHHGVLDAGGHFIQKPFSVKDLASKVRHVLDE